MKTRRELDLELVESAQAGDPQAFETLVQRYKVRLTRYLSLLIRDPADADDVVQDTFIRAYMALNNFRGEASFSTWLFRIGLNVAKHNLAKRGRQLPRASDPGDDEGGANEGGGETDFDTPEAKMETQEILVLLEEALARLPEEQRTSFELRELEGLSYEEIATQMDCPVGTVRSRIHRARDTLAAALKRH
jgi:RNA polymerase sigma-70 factor (ECF subfamily)